jgi:hypothetical protein
VRIREAPSRIVISIAFSRRLWYKYRYTTAEVRARANYALIAEMPASIEVSVDVHERCGAV